MHRHFAANGTACRMLGTVALMGLLLASVGCGTGPITFVYLC